MYSDDNFLEKVIIDLKDETRYVYNHQHIQLTTVHIARTSSWTQYLYDDNNGHHVGYKVYGHSNEVIQSFSSELHGVGSFQMIENPGEKLVDIMFDSSRRPVWTLPKGNLPIKVVIKDNERAIFVDDLVSL